MPKFSWEGKNRAGQVQKGEMEANDQAAVSAVLRRQGISRRKSRRWERDLILS